MKKMMLILLPLFILGTLLAAPLNEGFESATCPPSGWTIRYANSNPPSGNLMTHSTDYAYQGTRSFRFSSFSSGSPYDEYLITPQLLVTEGDQTVSFWYRSYSSYGSEVFRVGWSSTGTEITNFTWSSDITNASTSWQQYSKTDLPVGTKYVAVHYKSNYQYYLYIDAFVGPQIDVSAPPNPAVLVYPTNGGWAFLNDTLSWTSGGGIVDGYKLYISYDDNVDDSDFIIDQTGTTYSLSDLEDLEIEYGHTYYWKVIPHNEIGDADGCEVWSFKTPTATQLAESFTGTTFPPTGWTSPATSWIRDTSTYYSAPASAKCGYTSGTWWLVTPKLSPTAENQTLSFMYRDYSSSSSYDYDDEYTYVLVSTTTDFTGADVIWEGDYEDFTTEWQQAVLDLSAYIDTNIYIAFKHIATGGNNRYIDNVFGPEITQAPPDPAVLVYPADGGWAFLDDTLSWTSGGGTVVGYKLYISDDDIVNEEDFIIDQTGTTYSLSDLEDLVIEYGHTYYWQVVPYNNNGDAEGCPVWSFKTPTTTQLAESFENTTFPPTGWANPGTWSRNTYTIKHGIASAYKYGSTSSQYILSTPKVSITDDSTLDFWSNCSSTSGILQIVYSSDRTTWTQLGSNITFAATYTWYHNVIDLSSLAENNYYLGFRTAYSGSYYVDAVFGPEITSEAPEAPTLVSPADEAVNVSITPTFSWTAATTGGVPDGFKIYCGNPIDYDNPIATVSRTTTSYKIPGTNALAYNTTYQWTVSAYKEGFEDARAAERSFTTMEDPTIYDFPYTAGDFETGALPINWTVSEGSPGSSYHWQAKTGSTGHGITQAHSGTYYGWLNCYFAQTTYNPYYLITAPIDLSATDNPKRLNYWYWIGTNSFPATADNPLCVDISTDNQESWTTIYSHSKTENLSNWYQNIVDLTDYNDDIVYLRFRAYSSYGSGQTDMGLDDIIIEAIPSGPVLECTPTSLDFGEVAFGVQVGPKKVTVTNTGSGVLALNKADNTQIVGTGFAIDDFDFSLAANESGQINVYANATQEGPFTATLRITYGTQQCDIALSATGLPEGIIVIGTGTEDLGLPIDPLWGYSYSQSIFLQSEINMARPIEKIYYYWNGAAATVNSNNWTVYMGHTPNTSFDSGTAWIPLSNLTEVFSGTVTLPAIEGWVEIILTTPFTYNNVDNLVVAVDENADSYDSYNEYFYCTSELKTNRSIRYYSDGTNPDPLAPPTGTPVAGYPNIMLKFEEEQPPLPVELSSFTAVLTNDFYVQLTWVSQTETNLSGYRVYRNEENTLNNAILITPTMIPATNTSQEHIYTVEDREVENNTTYYYWLESVDFNNSQFHGPVIVTVEGNVPPVLPEVTTLNNAYPNPFRANNSTKIEVGIKAGESGTLTIYNIRGEIVKAIKVNEGYHTIIWDGKDSKGTTCGSGIYFYRLTTPSLNQTKKMVIVK